MNCDQLTSVRSEGVFFFLTGQEYFPLRGHFVSSCLIKGLRDLDIPVFTNIAVPGCITKPLEKANAWLYVFQISHQSGARQFSESVVRLPLKRKIQLSMEDENSAISLAPGVRSLMTHENELLRFKPDRLPWAFGLSDDVLQATEKNPPFEERSFKIIRNFRPSANQDVRNFLDLSFVPLLEKYIPIDRAISSDHLERLVSSTGCLAYGGSILPDMLPNDYFKKSSAYREFSKGVDFLAPSAIVRWDSWRLWESLAAGCLTFHLDFEKYGFKLPEMPIPWKHYIPIDLEDMVGTVARFMDSRSRWADISQNGRTWARENYCPVACAKRLLAIVD